MPALEDCEIDQDGLADLVPVRAIVIYAANAILDNVIARDSAKQCVNPAPATKIYQTRSMPYAPPPRGVFCCPNAGSTIGQQTDGFCAKDQGDGSRTGSETRENRTGQRSTGSAAYSAASSPAVSSSTRSSTGSSIACHNRSASRLPPQSARVEPLVAARRNHRSHPTAVAVDRSGGFRGVRR